MKFNTILLVILFCSACVPQPAAGIKPTYTETSQTLMITSLPIKSPIISATAETSKTPMAARTKTPFVSQNTPSIFEPTNNAKPEEYSQSFQPILSIPFPLGFNRSSDPTYRYGSTQNGARIPHVGIEFYNDYGAPVLAAGDGIVAFAGTDDDQQWGQYTNFYGNLVIIEHKIEGIDDSIFSLYAHLSRIDVSTGDAVYKGEKIGEVGKSGAAFGSHLHFEVRFGQPLLSKTRNPELFLELNPTIENPDPALLVGRVVDKEGNYVEEADITIQKMSAEKVSDEYTFFIRSYAKNIPTDPQLKENFLLPNIPAGKYRISVYIKGIFVEKKIEIGSNQLFFVDLQPAE